MEQQWIAPLSAAVYWGAVGLRAWRLKRRIGRSPNLRARTGKEKMLWLGWVVVSLSWALSPFFSVRFPFEGSVSFITGLVLVLAGFAGTFWAHASMGDAWRIGVDGTEKTPLVTKGPYSRMRHPIYAFQCLILAGIFLLEPSPVTLLALFIHRTLVSFKLRDEEEHLERLHGPLYKEYRARTGSLWPKFNSA